jgi:hypothetical protein
MVIAMVHKVRLREDCCDLKSVPIPIMVEKEYIFFMVDIRSHPCRGYRLNTGSHSGKATWAPHFWLVRFVAEEH